MKQNKKNKISNQTRKAQKVRVFAHLKNGRKKKDFSNRGNNREYGGDHVLMEVKMYSL